MRKSFLMLAFGFFFGFFFLAGTAIGAETEEKQFTKAVGWTGYPTFRISIGEGQYLDFFAGPNFNSSSGNNDSKQYNFPDKPDSVFTQDLQSFSEDIAFTTGIGYIKEILAFDRYRLAMEVSPLFSYRWDQQENKEEVSGKTIVARWWETYTLSIFLGIRPQVYLYKDRLSLEIPLGYSASWKKNNTYDQSDYPNTYSNERSSNNTYFSFSPQVSSLSLFNRFNLYYYF